MPAAFICSSSCLISDFVTAGPNHHQRTMMRQSSGGCANDWVSSRWIGGPWASLADRQTNKSRSAKPTRFNRSFLSTFKGRSLFATDSWMDLSRLIVPKSEHESASEKIT